MKKQIIFLFLVFVIVFPVFSQNEITIFGVISDSKGKPIPSVNVILQGTTTGVLGDETGKYLVKISSKKNSTLIFSLIGYVAKEFSISADEKRLFIEQNISLEIDEVYLNEISVVDNKKRNEVSIVKLDPKVVQLLPSASGNSIETMIKLTAGVSSHSELSSQYCVRGGNFDENLVYVNDIEIYRPFLIRSGQQEGLSFLNSDLVSAISFSTGGFESKYDDKMSSVLDIKYRRPIEFGGSVSGSLLGTNAHVEGTGFKEKLTFLAGIRYKSSKYLLKNLEESGEYNPNFLDIQTYLTYKFSSKFDVAFLANISQNSYKYIPKSRETTFGTLQNAVSLNIDFAGQEKDEYFTQFGALTFDFHPNKNLRLKLIASSFQTQETETYDIFGLYLLNELDQTMSSERFGDSLLNLGYGSYLEHARNYLTATVLNINHKADFTAENHFIQWGIKFQQESISDKLNEWKLMDSAGYSIPYNEKNIPLNRSFNAKNSLTTQRLSGYIQDCYSFSDVQNFSITAGIRFHYWDFNKEFLLSPRFSISYPVSKRFILKFLTGFYYQPPFYRELRDFDGNINKNIKSQKSIHFVLGSEYDMKIWDRPFKFIAELYYKKLDNLIPYEVDNIRIRYYARQIAKGYATGIDLRLNGEFVEGTESWASISLLQTKEDIDGDDFGYIPRPSDQLLNIALFFQDYLPNNDSYKMYLSLYYGSELPFGPPNTERGKATLRMPSYKRVDIGFSKIFIDEKTKLSASNPFRFLKSAYLSFEVFNLLGFSNTVSYLWISVVPNENNQNASLPTMYAVPNHLTSRMLNLRLSLKF